MPQKVIKYEKKPKIAKQYLRSFASFVARVLWPMIPRSLFLNRIVVINVALTRACNANCVFCAYQYFEKEQRISMSDKIFEYVIENIKKFAIPFVSLSPNVGEPLLAPNFIEKVKALRKAGVKTIQCTTNGTMLKKIGIDKILEDGPDGILISTAGFDKKMYKRVYRIDKYKEMRDGVLELLKKNSLLKQPKAITIQLRGDIDIHRQLNTPEMKIVMELADEVTFMTEVDPWNERITQDLLTGNLRLQASSYPLTLRPCRQIMEVAIYPDGGIHVCPCRNLSQDKDLYLGNILEDNIFVAYQRINEIFKKWENGYIPSVCRKCYMYTDPTLGILGHINKWLLIKR